MIIFGILGLLLISLGVLLHDRHWQDIDYICGGVCLLIYSLHLGDLIFVILQIVFIFSASFDLVKEAKHT
ncbi:MAG: hypothetical protein ACMXYK_01875 [Candidatus Woesearchaeota archaeon]